MYELIQAGQRTWYIDCPAKIGVFLLQDGSVCLIDAGNDKDAGKKALKILDGQGWKLSAVVNTHSHADHTGGNHLLAQRTGCKIFAPGIEAAFTRNPVLEPSFLFGAYPPKELQNKFLMAAPSDALDFTHPDFPAELEPVPLEGHFFNMRGLRTPDGTVFLADCVSSAQTLEKYRVPFLYDVAKYLETLEAVERMEARMFVPAHAPATDDIAPLARLNREKLLEILEMLLDICHQAICFEDILQQIFLRCGLSMNFDQYALVGSTVRSCLSYLKDAGRVSISFADAKLLWKRV